MRAVQPATAAIAAKKSAYAGGGALTAEAASGVWSQPDASAELLVACRSAAKNKKLRPTLTEVANEAKTGPDTPKAQGALLYTVAVKVGCAYGMTTRDTHDCTSIRIATPCIAC